MGRVIAEYSDYALAYQLAADAFMEALGGGQRYTDERIRLIENEGRVTPKGLSEKLGITVPAVTQWMRPWIEKGMLVWCDDHGNAFADAADLEKAKRAGMAHVKVAGRCCLPTPFQLTGDSRWNESGELYVRYDLGFRFGDKMEVKADAEDLAELSEPVEPDVFEELIRKHSADDAKGVKALSEKTGIDNEFEKSGDDVGLVSMDAEGLSDEFKRLLQMN
jgi:hypothetical protein